MTKKRKIIAIIAAVAVIVVIPLGIYLGMMLFKKDDNNGGGNTTPGMSDMEYVAHVIDKACEKHINVLDTYALNSSASTTSYSGGGVSNVSNNTITQLDLETYFDIYNYL